MVDRSPKAHPDKSAVSIVAIDMSELRLGECEVLEGGDWFGPVHGAPAFDYEDKEWAEEHLPGVRLADQLCAMNSDELTEWLNHLETRGELAHTIALLLDAKTGVEALLDVLRAAASRIDWIIDRGKAPKPMSRIFDT